MAVVAFGVLFAGVVSSVLAGATTVAAAGVHPAGLAARPGSAIPDRLAGWGLRVGGVAARDRAAVAGAGARSGARRGDRGLPRAGGAGCARRSPTCSAATASVAAERDAAIARPTARSRRCTDVLRDAYRPTGLSTAARTVVRLVDELSWLDAIVVQAAPRAGERARSAGRRGQGRGGRGARARRRSAGGAAAVAPRRCTRRWATLRARLSGSSAARPRALAAADAARQADASRPHSTRASGPRS